MAEKIEKKETLKHLEALIHLDIDAVHAYKAAIDRIDLVDVKAKLTEFREDHVRHIRDLSQLIVRFGGVPPKMTPDFKGFVIEGFTALRSMIGNESAIRAMKSNEMLTNKNYDKVLKVDFPTDVKTVIEKNRDDERRHLDYINKCIDVEVWTRSEKTVA